MGHRVANTASSPEWQLVKSSNVLAVAYQDVGVVRGPGEPYGTVYVAYKTGAVWQYTGVPEHTYETILAAESKGQAVNALLVHRGQNKLGALRPERLRDLTQTDSVQ